ncbi:MAG TPA: hypothetical protein VHO47_04990 [Candidatus Babeliales bacterium]|nr:hypothetical protein [Candidatus Babeliales bacterium]
MFINLIALASILCCVANALELVEFKNGKREYSFPELLTIKLENYPFCFTISDDTKYIAFLTRYNTGELLSLNKDASKVVSTASINVPDYFFKTVYFDESTLSFWNPSQHYPLRNLTYNEGYDEPRAFSYKKSLIAESYHDLQIRIFCLDRVNNKKNNKNSLYHTSGSVTSLAFNQEGSLLASGAHGGELFIWDTHSWKKKSTKLLGHVLALSFSNDDQRLAAGSTHGKAFLLDSTNLEIIARIDYASPTPIHQVVFNADDSLLICALDEEFRISELKPRFNAQTPPFEKSKIEDNGTKPLPGFWDKIINKLGFIKD